MNDWMTIAEIENQINIPNATIRRYIYRHGNRIVFKKQHKSYLISSDSIDTLIKIRDLYGSGLSSEQVDDELSKIGVTTIITVNDNDERVTVSASEALMELQKQMTTAMNAMTNEIENLRNELSDLKMENKQLRSFISKCLGETVAQVVAASENVANKFDNVELQLQQQEEQLYERNEQFDKKLGSIQVSVDKERGEIHRHLSQLSETIKQMENKMESVSKQMDTVITESRTERHKRKGFWNNLFGR